MWESGLIQRFRPPEAGPPLAEKHMAITYIIFSKNKNQFYVGSSRNEDLLIRLKSHNSGKVRSTKSGRPWIQVVVESFSDYTEARKREIFLKSGIGRQWIKNKFGNIKEF